MKFFIFLFCIITALPGLAGFILYQNNNFNFIKKDQYQEITQVLFKISGQRFNLTKRASLGYSYLKIIDRFYISIVETYYHFFFKDRVELDDWQKYQEDKKIDLIKNSRSLFLILSFYWLYIVLIIIILALSIWSTVVIILNKTFRNKLKIIFLSILDLIRHLFNLKMMNFGGLDFKEEKVIVKDLEIDLPEIKESTEPQESKLIEESKNTLNEIIPENLEEIIIVDDDLEKTKKEVNSKIFLIIALVFWVFILTLCYNFFF